MPKNSVATPKSVSALLQDLRDAGDARLSETLAAAEDAATFDKSSFNPFSRPAVDLSEPDPMPPVTPRIRSTTSLKFDLELEVDTTHRTLHKTLRTLARMPISVQSLQTVETFARLSREMLELLDKK
jgi:hypothetical protein